MFSFQPRWSHTGGLDESFELSTSDENLASGRAAREFTPGEQSSDGFSAKIQHRSRLLQVIKQRLRKAAGLPLR